MPVQEFGPRPAQQHPGQETRAGRHWARCCSGPRAKGARRSLVDHRETTTEEEWEPACAPALEMGSEELDGATVDVALGKGSWSKR